MDLKGEQARTVYHKAALDLIRNIICGDVGTNLNKETQFFNFKVKINILFKMGCLICNCVTHTLAYTHVHCSSASVLMIAGSSIYN